MQCSFLHMLLNDSMIPTWPLIHIPGAIMSCTIITFPALHLNTHLSCFILNILVCYFLLELMISGDDVLNRLSFETYVRNVNFGFILYKEICRERRLAIKNSDACDVLHFSRYASSQRLPCLINDNLPCFMHEDLWIECQS